MGRFHSRFCLALAFALGACSSGSPFDDTAMFAQHFGAGQLVIGTPPLSAALAGSNEPTNCALAQLVQSGRIRFAPSVDGEPYVSMSAADNSNGGGGTTLFIGKRVFESSAEEERFTRNANDYFAQTITYYIRGENTLIQPPNASGFGPFSLRAVYVRDPAVGQWRLDSFAPISGGEVQGSDLGAINTILADVAQRGCPTDAMAQAAQAARTDAMNQIERQLADAGVLARGPVPNTLVSRQNHRIWYTGAIDTTNSRWRDMFSLCNGVNVSAGRNWRPPDWNDLRSLMTPVQGSNDEGILIDTPDRRLFGNVINDRGQIRLLRGDLYTYNGAPTTLAQAEAHRAMYRTLVYKRSYDQREYRTDMNLTWTPGDYPLQGGVLLCVADYAA